MRFPPGLLDEIRARLPVSEVVGKRVRLQKAGREWKGLSPFNAEKSPSFFVNDQKGFYHDFSSGKHGDIFAFRHGDGGPAVPRGGGTAGRARRGRPAQALARRPRSRSGRPRRSARRWRWPPRFFQAELKGGRGGQARAYLDGRGLTLRRRGRISASATRRPSAIALRDHLAGKGVPRRGDDRGRPAGARPRTSPFPTTGSATASCSRSATARAGRSPSAAARWRRTSRPST